jgi:predicted XRE-type DNA-binding protein
MGFPSDEELNRMRKLLANVEGTRIVGEEGTKVERFKFEICQTILRTFKKSKVSQKEFSLLLSIDEALVSKLLNCKIEVFTIDRLLKFLEIVEPNYEIKLAL